MLINRSVVGTVYETIVGLQIHPNSVPLVLYVQRLIHAYLVRIAGGTQTMDQGFQFGLLLPGQTLSVGPGSCSTA